MNSAKIDIPKPQSGKHSSILARVLLATFTGVFTFLSCTSIGFAQSQSDDSVESQSNLEEEKARALNKEGASLLSQGKTREAADAFRKSIQAYPDGAAAHNNLALVLKEQGQLLEAEKEAKLALKLKPEKGNYHFNLALILQQEKKLAEAEFSFREAAKLNPMDPETHFRLAQILLAQSKPEEGELAIKMSLLMKPSEPSYHRLLADCLLQAKKYDAALCEYRSCLELNPKAADTGDIRSKIDYLMQVLKAPH